MSASGGGPRRRVAVIVLVCFLLGCHLWLRLQVARQAPLDRGSYPEHYAVALSLVGGMGFSGFDLVTDQRPEAEPVRAFLGLARERLSREELDAFLAGATPKDPALAVTWRVLDMRATAALWSVTGIDWRRLPILHAVLSTLAALALIALTARMAGTPWPGLVAGLLLLASPYESQWAIYSHRDVAPLWFASFGFAALFLLDTACRRWTQLPWLVLLGAAATLGLGWRLDALLVPAFVLAVLVLRRPLSGETAARRAAALLVFALTCWVCSRAILALGPPRTQSSGIGYQVAYYGEFTRANILGYENSFQVLRNDGQAYQHCAFYAERVLGIEAFMRGDSAYGAACRALYLDVARYNLFNWAISFPEFFSRSLTAFAPQGSLQSEVWPLHEVRPPGASALYTWVLDPLTRVAPWAAAIGLLALAAGGRLDWRALSLAAFGVVYAGILLLVLPEAKHAGVMLLPLYAFAGIGLWSVGVMVTRGGWLDRGAATLRRSYGLRRHALLPAAFVVAALAAAWLLSTSSRRQLIQAVLTRAEAAEPAARALSGRRFFSVTRHADRNRDPVGYLLEIRAGESPGDLICRHLRGIGEQTPARLYRTRHRLHPSRTQSFFIAALQGSRYGVGDDRSYVVTVTVKGDAEIRSVRQLDLAGWKHPLFTSVFREDDWSPGSPWLAFTASRRHPLGLSEDFSTRFDGLPGEDVNELGLRAGESPEADRLLSELRANPRRAWNRYRLLLADEAG